MSEVIPYNKPCKKCGSTNQSMLITNNRKAIYCPDCSNSEDIEVSEHLKQQWANETKNQNNQQVQHEQQSSKPTVECPYCHSIDTKKISGMSKAVHTAVFGIFSISRNSKQWHCNSCGSDF